MFVITFYTKDKPEKITRVFNDNSEKEAKQYYKLISDENTDFSRAWNVNHDKPITIEQRD